MSWSTVYTPNYVRSKLGITDNSQDIFLSNFISNAFINLEHNLGYSIENMGMVTNNKIIRDRYLDGKVFVTGAYQTINNVEICQISANPQYKTLILDQDYTNVYLKGNRDTIQAVQANLSLFPPNTQIRLSGTTGLATLKGLMSISTISRGTGGTLNSVVNITGDGVGATAKILSINISTITFEITNIGTGYTTMLISIPDITAGSFTANLSNTIPFDLELFIFELVRFAYTRQKTKGMTLESERSGNLSVSYGNIQNNPLTTLQLYAPELIPEFKKLIGWYKATYDYPF